MRTLALLLVVLHCVAAQPVPALGPSSYQATSLDGTTQYWNKTSPVNIAVQGSENITNPGAEANTTGWQADFGLTLTRNTNLDRVRTGVGSFALRSDGTTNGRFRATTGFANTTNYKWTVVMWLYAPSSNTGSDARLVLYTNTGASFGTGTTVTIPRDTWTRIVFTAQSSGTQTNIRAGMQFTNPALGDTLYIDDISCTQAYDIVMLAALKPTISNAAMSGVSVGRWNSATASGYALRTASSGRFVFSFAENSSSGVGVIANMRFQPGKTYFLAGVANRSDSTVLFIDGVPVGYANARQQLPPMNVQTRLQIGIENSSGLYWQGFVGPVQIIRFNALPRNINGRIAHLSRTWRQEGLPRSWPDGTIVLDVDWSRQGVNRSATGNDLSPVNAPSILQTN